MSKREAKNTLQIYRDFYGSEENIPVGDLAAAFNIPASDVPEFLEALQGSGPLPEKSAEKPQPVVAAKPVVTPPIVVKKPQPVVVPKPIPTQPIVKKDRTIPLLRWPMLAFAAMAVILSCYFTIDWLGNQQPKLIAWLMGITLIGFGMMAFQISSFMRTRGKRFVALGFMTAWVFLTSWSITNTVSSLYTHYTARQAKKTTQSSLAVADKAIYESLKSQEEEIIFRNTNKKADIAKYRAIVKTSEEKGDTSSQDYKNARWLVSVKEKELLSIAEELKVKREEIQAQLKKNSTVVETVKSLQTNEFFGWMAGIFKMDADLLQFIIMCIPAVILDIIASASLYVFLFLEKMVDSRKEKK